MRAAREHVKIFPKVSVEASSSQESRAQYSTSNTQTHRKLTARNEDEKEIMSIFPSANSTSTASKKVKFFWKPPWTGAEDGKNRPNATPKLSNHGRVDQLHGTSATLTRICSAGPRQHRLCCVDLVDAHLVQQDSCRTYHLEHNKVMSTWMQASSRKTMTRSTPSVTSCRDPATARAETQEASAQRAWSAS